MSVDHLPVAGSVQVTYHAVAQGAQSSGMDWISSSDLGSASDSGGADGFAGSVFVIDDDGRQVATAAWTAPSDAAADAALASLGWCRDGGWGVDRFGRRSAPVTPLPGPSGTSVPELPGQRRPDHLPVEPGAPFWW
ncbi:hypothetical protein [Nakamurella leprariae]|uniref:Uncharacterized protein n=1 Tax=Nakamurella leprariae TaxID=2803911 RepID=A0A938Y9Y4_9ACTN|nr:hypothetical protein [Nakamurella leprariae]MBM9465904.1 hypothetical protein [Nakamurella leprariae]